MFNFISEHKPLCNRSAFLHKPFFESFALVICTLQANLEALRKWFKAVYGSSIARFPRQNPRAFQWTYGSTHEKLIDWCSNLWVDDYHFISSLHSLLRTNRWLWGISPHSLSVHRRSQIQRLDLDVDSVFQRVCHLQQRELALLPHTEAKVGIRSRVWRQAFIEKIPLEQHTQVTAPECSTARVALLCSSLSPQSAQISDCFREFGSAPA
jgi:hypothetical protein